MPKLFVATGIFPPEPGGPATYLKTILPPLQSSGWQPRVLSFGQPQAEAGAYPVARVARSFYPIRQARYAIASRAPLAWADLVFIHSIDLPLWGKGDKPRVIKVVGDQAWERCVRRGWLAPDLGIDDFQAYAGDWRVRWQKRSRSRQIAAMDGVIVPSQYLKRMVVSWGIEPASIHVIYNAPPPMQPPGEPRDEIRARLGWDDRPTLITVARLQRWKGIDFLIEALRGLSDLRLIVVGAGPDRARLEALAAPLGERVVFTGALERSQVHRLIAAAEGLALYSGYEGLSHTLLEGLRLGAPALASDVGGNPEIIRHGVNGLLVPYPDAAELKRGILELLDRREELASKAGAGLDRFSLDAMVAQTDALLRSLL